MALDKAIEHGREHRKQYKGAQAIDSQCRNHGSCEWCLNGRLHKYKRQDSSFFNHKYKRYDISLFEDLKQGLEEAIEFENKLPRWDNGSPEDC